jgi:hypothetical protein
VADHLRDKLARDRFVSGRTGKEGGKEENSHVHDQDAGFVKFFDDFAWRNADGGNEEMCLLFDDDVDELR